MANLTDRYEKKLLDGLTGSVPLTTPTITYLALFTADPSEAGSIANEATGNGGYVRASLSGAFSTATSSSTSNSSEINFPTATADWTEITHMGIMESGTSGVDDMMVHIQLDNPITILSNEIFSIQISDLTIIAD